MTCAAAISFVPELDLFRPSRQETILEKRRPAPAVASNFVSVQDIVVSSGGMPLRHLTEPEQRALDRALYKSVRIIDTGRLNQSL